MKKAIVFIFLLPIASNCTLIGFGAGALVDSANSKKVDTISSKNQRVNLVYKDGKKVNVRYRGLVYSIPPMVSDKQSGNTASASSGEMHFPSFGENIEIEDNSGNRITGAFEGIHKTKNQYLLIVKNPGISEDQQIALTSISTIRYMDGRTINNIPGYEKIALLFESDNQIYKAHLNILDHINLRSKNNKILLGSVGLLVDLVAVASCCEFDLQ